MTGLAAARQLGADHPFDDDEARRTFNYYGGIMYGRRFRKVKGRGRSRYFFRLHTTMSS